MTSDGERADETAVGRVRATLVASLTPDERETRAYYIDTVVHPSGSEIRLGTIPFTVRCDTVVVFVDDEPGKNWAHACRYLLFDVATGEVETVPGEFPPSLTEVPGTYRPLSVPPGVPAWALWYSE